MSKKKIVEVSEYTKLLNQRNELQDLCDGLMMKLQALEGKINALERNVAHSRDSLIRANVTAEISEKFAFKLFRFAVSRPDLVRVSGSNDGRVTFNTEEAKADLDESL